MNDSSKRKLKYGSYSIILSVTVILIAVAINLLVSLLPPSYKRIDLTELKLSELSDVTKEYLNTLTEDITIARLCITGEEDDTVGDMLDKYAECSDKIKIVDVDPAVRPTFVSKYTDDSLDSNSVIVIGDKRAKAVNYYNMFTFALYYTDEQGNTIFQGEMSYGDFQTFYQYYSSYFGTYYSYDTLFAGESAITSAIDYVTTDKLPKMYFVTGHGESPLSDALLSNLALDNIDSGELSIIASGIPEDADCLLINSPMTDFSESEADALELYLTNGGNVILFTDPEFLELPLLFGVMESYGLSPEKGYICESSNYMGQTYMVLPDISVASSMLGIGGYSVVAPLAHPIKINEDEEHSASYLKLFQSSTEAYIKDEIEDEENNGEDDLVKDQYTMGVLATIETQGEISHIMWISCPGFATDEINSYSTGGNYLYFLSLSERLTNKSTSLSIISKMMVEESLVINFAQQIFWTAVLCVIIPVAALAAGGYIVISRRRR